MPGMRAIHSVDSRSDGGGEEVEQKGSMRAERKNCPMRHQGNGNCLPAGGFCTANGDEYCKALRNAYEYGWINAAVRAVRILERHKDAEETE